MKELTDCNGIPYPIYAIGTVTMCGTVEGANPQGSVYMLKVEVTEENAQLPLAGQFYMLRAMKTGILLGRPISIFHAEKTPHGVELQFLILVKGKGTQELCALEADDKIQLLGPLGNTFAKPEATDKVCIVGGGIGVAPVAGFSENLNPNTYDFYACFKSGSYGLENVKAKNLIITTDDGSVGTKGMVSAVLTAQKLKDEGYSVVYACGPTPMLAYIKAICQEANVKCWISMEARMACGMGVCLGCTIPTTEGYKRCCKDGPIFDGTILEFLKPVATVKRPPLTEEPDLSVEIAGVKFKNPLIGSSGTFGFGTEYAPLFDVNKLGGISSKGLTLEPRQGNSGIRLWETPSGLMNSIGLQNPGIPHFIEHELPEMMALDAVTIANLSGSTLESYVEGAKLLDKTDVPVIELNISCPNVAAGGAAFGMSCAAAHTATKAVREVTKKPLLVKLTPQSPELIDVALSCIKAGADGISLCNSFQGVAIDIETGRPVFDKIKAGFGGPAVRPIAVRLVYELVQAINQLPENERVPVVAIGGVAGWQDVVEFIMAGATAVSVGTANFFNPYATVEVVKGIQEYMERNNVADIHELIGCVK
jgi:dihydroorotate dehydrogenase (NAD+) catalytic subunit